MNLNNFVSVDIETLGIAPGCQILQISAISSENEIFNIDRIEFSSFGRVDQDTLNWWLKSERLPRFKSFFSSPKITLRETLILFQEYLKKLPDGFFTVMKGPHFDWSILSEAFSLYKLENPMRYNKVIDLRTLSNYTNIFSEKEATHDALEDAIEQKLLFEKILKARNA